MPSNALGRSKKLRTSTFFPSHFPKISMFKQNQAYIIKKYVFIKKKLSMNSKKILTSTNIYHISLQQMDYWPGIPSVMFGAMGILSGILVLTQPETLGTKMPDTLAEAEALGKPESKVQRN